MIPDLPSCTQLSTTTAGTTKYQDIPGSKDTKYQDIPGSKAGTNQMTPRPGSKESLSI